MGRKGAWNGTKMHFVMFSCWLGRATLWKGDKMNATMRHCQQCKSVTFSPGWVGAFLPQKYIKGDVTQISSHKCQMLFLDKTNRCSPVNPYCIKFAFNSNKWSLNYNYVETIIQISLIVGLSIEKKMSVVKNLGDFFYLSYFCI